MRPLKSIGEFIAGLFTAGLLGPLVGSVGMAALAVVAVAALAVLVMVVDVLPDPIAWGVGGVVVFLAVRGIIWPPQRG